MKVTADTDVLVRALMGDEPAQSLAAQNALQTADLVAVPLATLCELVWVLRSGYRIDPSEVSGAIRRLIAAGHVVVDRPAVEAGLALLENGGDFADGLIAFDGARLGAETFLFFDRKAVKLISQQGGKARLLA